MTRPVAALVSLPRARVSPWLRAEVVVPASVALVFVLLAGLTWGTWGDLGHDTGYDLLAAHRIADGQLPYADFPYIYGPLGVFLLGGADAVLGSGVDTAIALGLVLSALAVGLTYRLALEVTDAAGAAVAALLTTAAAMGTGNVGLVMPHSLSVPVAVVASLAGLLAACAYARTERVSRLVLAGLALGATALTRPEYVAALGGASVLWLGLRVLDAEAPDRGRELRRAGIFAAVAVAVPAVVYGAFLTAVSPRELISDNLFPSAQLASGGNSVLRSSAPLTARSFADLAAELVLYAVFVAGLLAVAAALTKGPRAARLVRIGVAVAIAGFGLVLVARPEAVRTRIGHAYEWIPAGAVLLAAALVWVARRRRGAWTVREQAALLCATFLAVLAAKTYAGFAPQPNPDFAQFATYAVPFVAILLAWLHLEVLPRWGGAPARALGLAWISILAATSLVLVAHDGRGESGTVRGPGGTLTVPAGQVAPYQGALDAIRTGTRPGEPVLIAPQLTALYELADRPNPLPQISLLPGALATRADEDAAIRRLSGVRIAVIDRRALTEYGQGAFGTTFDQRLGDWLHTHFHHVKTIRGSGGGAAILDIWQRSQS